MNPNPPRSSAERQRDYVRRLDAAGKTKMILVVEKSFARQVRERAHASVMPPGDLLAKAWAAFQETEALAAGATETAS